MREILLSILMTASLAVSMPAQAPAGEAAQASKIDPMVGTWKLNLEKSKFNNDYPAPKSETILIEQQQGGVLVTADPVNFRGKPAHVVYSLMFDGKDYPVTGAPQDSEFGFGNAAADTVAVKRIDSRTVSVIRKQEGQVVSTQEIAISKDGKERISYWNAKNAKGEPITWMTIFGRQ
jgi:hypothetical protein